MLTKHLEDAKAVGLAAAKLYANALGQFGGVTSLMPPNPLAYNIFFLDEVQLRQAFKFSLAELLTLGLFLLLQTYPRC
jgi:hypothetical protein